MTDDLYERYKEALRNGHVAVLRGSLEEALAAYRVAAEIAPSRALPHTSLGGVYMRLGHLEDALTEFAAAVARAPRDEGALLGQAEALTAAGMRSDAATALDHVAEIQEAAGRVPEAADTLRRAAELEETPDRIRRQRAMLREIRFSAGDHAAEQLLARALRLRDESPAEVAARRPAAEAFGSAAVVIAPAAAAFALAPAAFAPAPSPAPAEPEIEPLLEPAAELADVITFAPRQVAAVPVYDAYARTVVETYEPAAVVSHVSEPVPAEALEPAAPLVSVASRVPAEMPAWPAADLKQLEKRDAAPEPVHAGTVAALESEPEPVWRSEPELEPVAAAIAERAAVGVMVGIEGLPTVIPGSHNESYHQPTGDELLTAAEAAELAGDATTLRSLLLWTARAYAREGRFEAGLDATHRLLARTPSDVDAHLVLVELYVARGWDGLAADKLRLLGRLADLNNDPETRQRLCAAATRAFPNTPSLESLCS